jgi:hypothetical protein
MRIQTRDAVDQGHWRIFRFLFSAILASTLGCHSEQPAKFVPDVSLPQVRGGAFALRRPQSELLLLAFLQTVPDTADTPSHREVAFLRSMSHQYSSRGLKVAIVDSSALAGRRPTHEDLLNASYDWQLDIPLLEDRESRLASRLAVRELPTLLLVAPQGSISRRWEGFIGPASLAQGIEDQLGRRFGQVRNLSQ